MKYSIIIPTLNEEKLITRLLQQLNETSLRAKYNFEIIISDGGSQDKTLEFAGDYTDKIVKHSGDKKQNIAEGRNKGAEVAEGEILIFFNADVIIADPDKFFDCIENRLLHSDFSAMTCSVIVSPSEAKLNDRIFLSFYNFYFHILNIIGVGMGRGECHIIKKTVFIEVAGYNEAFVAGEDFELYKRIRKRGKILFARDLFVFESPRRYRRYSHWTIFFSWLFNSIFVIFRKRSLLKEWEQIR